MIPDVSMEMTGTCHEDISSHEAFLENGVTGGLRDGERVRLHQLGFLQSRLGKVIGHVCQ